ncbi:MAG: nickel pincer cofactor biosynthesis protein LarC [Clostridiales bacterium]|nr:nickel pincer cofactor biosynthesis protein LarC [Clostridiales bacterium]
MKTLYLDCSMGAAGDMLTAALLELLPDPDAFVEHLNGLEIPGVEFRREKTQKCGITGTHMSVLVHGREEDPHMHENARAHSDGKADHCHAHVHEHHGMHEITHIVEALKIPSTVKTDILDVYGLIAEAESHVHGVPVDDIHFHEVGTMDAVADITAVCLLMHEICPDETVVSPVHVGCGQVRCAHGILPVPAPATAFILKGIPTYGGEIHGELCTPTGAALIKHFATRFGNMPVMSTEEIGYGMGKKDFERANCVRAMLGNSPDLTDTILEMSCNVDDMTAEEIGFAEERLFEAGAVEVYTLPVGMKKSRPGCMICALCREPDRERILSAFFKHTSTLGVRENVYRRYVLSRAIETIPTPYGEIRRKVSEGYGVTRVKLEYEDLTKIAREKGISIREAEDLVKQK